ncbi:hypothetical protein QBD00_004233 [Ochrobactrum sp. AN78]|nr:hypothetical protein [Ochrobactrum sp. AN78]
MIIPDYSQNIYWRSGEVFLTAVPVKTEPL